ncbi:pectinesterase family protein [Paenibacillus vandeheii]
MINWRTFIISVLISVPLFSIIPTDDALASTLLDHSHFNTTPSGALPSGFTISEVGGQVRAAEVPSPSNRSVFLNDTSITAISSLKKTITAQTGYIDAEFKFMQPALGNNTKIFRLLNGAKAAVSIETVGGNISYRNMDNSYITLQSGYAANTWYSIRIVANTATNTADVYVNGLLITSGAGFYTTVSHIDGYESFTPNSSEGAHYLDDILVKNATATIPPDALVVSKSGESGVFTTIQAAVDAIPVNQATSRTIYVKNGVYREKITFPANKPNISLIGESALETILTYDDTASSAGGTTNSASVYVKGKNFKAENITIRNTAGVTAGQAVALYVSGDRATFNNVRILGNQDTLYAHSGRQYYRDSYIEGTVDFIFGSATAVFESCEIKSLNNGFITAASTDQSAAHGYVFINSSLTQSASMTGTAFLGRPWRPYASVVYVNSYLESHINPTGWDYWGNEANKSTARYSEYGNSGPGASTESRVSWSHSLSPAQAAVINTQSVLAGSDQWDPIN